MLGRQALALLPQANRCRAGVLTRGAMGRRSKPGLTYMGWRLRIPKSALEAASKLHVDLVLRSNTSNYYAALTKLSTGDGVRVDMVFGLYALHARVAFMLIFTAVADWTAASHGSGALLPALEARGRKQRGRRCVAYDGECGAFGLGLRVGLGSPPASGWGLRERTPDTRRNR